MAAGHGPGQLRRGGQCPLPDRREHPSLTRSRWSLHYLRDTSVFNATVTEILNPNF